MTPERDDLADKFSRFITDNRLDGSSVLTLIDFCTRELSRRGVVTPDEAKRVMTWLDEVNGERR